MTLELSVKCNRCGNIEQWDIRDIRRTIEFATKQGRELEDLTYRCGECHAADAAKAMERIFS